MEHSHCDKIVDATIGPSSDSRAASEGKHQLRRSTMGAEQEESGHRTSSTAWLHEDRCPLPLRTFATRAAALCGLPPRNMENLQVVRYEPGEEFQLHTDHLDRYVIQRRTLKLHLVRLWVSRFFFLIAYSFLASMILIFRKSDVCFIKCIAARLMVRNVAIGANSKRLQKN